jgi:NitT/TauT family transport system substrate-binding protein
LKHLLRIEARAVLLAVLWLAGGTAAMAQTVTVRIARQFGISYMPLTIMEQNQLTCASSSQECAGGLILNGF